MVLVTHTANGGSASAMLHIGAGNGSNSQLILKQPRYYVFFNNSQAKKISKRIWWYQMHYTLQIGSGLERCYLSTLWETSQTGP